MLATKRKPADRVLVVNDVPDQVGIMKVMLEKSGYSVLTAFDGRQALETAEQSLPDIIISDVSMPRMNGIELCTAIRNHPQLRSIPVLLVSANCKDSESIVRGLRSGADDYLEAPYDPMRLVVKAAHLIENRRADEKIRESEARFRSLAETATDVILTVDSEGKILFINSSVERVFGYGTEELTGEQVAVIIPEYLQQVASIAIKNEIDSARERLCCEPVEVAGRHKSGYEVPLEVSFGEFVKDGNTFYTGIARDIAARKQAEERLSRSEERLRLAQQAGDIGVFDWNVNTGQVAWTTELEALFGLGPGTFEGTMEHWRRHVHPDDLSWTDESLQAVISNRTRDWHEEYRILRAETYESRWMDVFGQFFYDEDGAAQRMVGVIIDTTERKKAEEKLKRSEAQLAEAQSVSQLGSWEWEPETENSTWSDELFRLVGLEAGETPITQAMVQRYLLPSEVSGKAIKKALEDEQPFIFEHVVVGATGIPLVLQVRGRVVPDNKNKVSKVIGTAQDITELKKAEEALRRSEEQFLQAQKMEAIGQLAGGVAHDFNNLLTAIIVSSDLVLHKLNAADPLRRNIEEIKKASNRASSLTRQLLAFSRRQVLQPQVLSINSIILDMAQMLPRLIGENIELDTLLDQNLGSVKADPGQIEQVILNLAVNARDAMPDGGRLTIETRNVNVSEQTDHHVGLEPGPYVRISVSDNGMGMGPETQEHIFEPFFTTKEAGKGTGLGLSTVYGIIKQSGGSIWVFSELGQGTTLKIYLPRVDEEAIRYNRPSVSHEIPKGTETILLVEDEEIVRGLAREVLEMNGYKVLESGDPQDAISLCQRHKGPIHLLLTDVVMPGMSGRTLADRVSKIRPGLRIAYMSGYTSDAIVHHGVLDADVRFIQKPFTPDSLARTLRAVLDEP